MYLLTDKSQEERKCKYYRSTSLGIFIGETSQVINYFDAHRILILLGKFISSINQHIMKIKSIVGFLIIGGSLLLSSCKDDEPAKSGVSFEISEEFLKESDGTLESFHPLLVQNATGREVEVKIQFDEPLAQSAVIEYSIGGTATKNSINNPVGDFEIVGNGENITVAKGATEASIIINVFEDFDFEVEEDDADGFFETIEITIESIVSGPVKIGEQDTYVLTIYEDDAVIFLDWLALDDGDGTTPGDVDMDLLIWLDGEVAGASDSPGTDPEGIAIPAGFPDDAYGMSYTYYEGTSDDIEFTVGISNLGGTLNVNDQELSFTGNYGLININKYDEEGAPDPQIIQTMIKSGYNYTNLTDINEPLEGSRVKHSGQSLRDRIKQTNIRTLQSETFRKSN